MLKTLIVLQIFYISIKNDVNFEAIQETLLLII